MEGFLNGYSKIMAFDLYILNMFRSYILQNGLFIKPKKSTLLISSHELSPLMKQDWSMKQGTNMMHGWVSLVWIGINHVFHIDYDHLTISHMQYSTFTQCICDISHLRYIAYVFCKCWISHMRCLTLQNAYAIYRICVL